MAEEMQTEGQQSVQFMVDERDLRVVYANGYRINSAAEEVILDLGFNMLNPNAAAPQANQPQQVLFKISDRVVMSYGNAKRLALSLQQLVKRYEQQFGELPLQPGQRK